MKKSLLLCLLLISQSMGITPSVQAVNYNMDYAGNLDKGIQYYQQKNYSQAKVLFLQLLKQPNGKYFNNPAIAKWLFSSMSKAGSSSTEILSLARDIINKTPEKGGTVEVAHQIIRRIKRLQKVENKQKKAIVKPEIKKPLNIKYINKDIKYEQHYLCQVPIDIKKLREERWFIEEFPLKVYIDWQSGPSTIVKKAFKQWSLSWPQMQFDFVNHLEMADIKVSWNTHDTSSKPELHIPPTWHHIGHKSTIVLPSNISSNNLFGLALHKIGHALGLPDSPNSNDIMSHAGYSKRITKQDTDTLKKIYSLPEKLLHHPCPQIPTTLTQKQRWYIKIFNQDDIASVYVNNEHGVADLIAYNDKPSDWIDITDKIYSVASNRVRFTLKNKGGGYSWGFAIKHGEKIIWQDKGGKQGKVGAHSNNQSKEVNEVYNKLIIISPEGQVISQIDQFQPHEIQHMY